jgi:hypothetical protein
MEDRTAAPFRVSISYSSTPFATKFIRTTLSKHTLTAVDEASRLEAARRAVRSTMVVFSTQHVVTFRWPQSFAVAF